MNTPSDPNAVGKLTAGVSTLWGAATSAVKKYKDKKARIDHFAAGHQGAGSFSPEHLSMLIEGATKLDAQRHSQTMERFKAADAASKPGKKIGISAAGDINLSEKRPKAAPQQEKPAEEKAPAKAAAPKAAAPKTAAPKAAPQQEKPAEEKAPAKAAAPKAAAPKTAAPKTAKPKAVK